MTKAETKERVRFLQNKGKEYAKSLTEKATAWELLFKANLECWEINFVFQKPVVCNKDSLFILDFYLPEYKVAVELDGAQHYTKEGKKKDKRRTRLLKKEGIHVLRVPNSLVNTITKLNFKNLLTPYVSNR
jgi:very-short-patch-repair endonuclease